MDSSEPAGETFKANNFGDHITLDLSKQTVRGNYDLVIGGPPCKPWSNVNLIRRGKSHRDYLLLDSYFNHVEQIRPKAFLLENVPPLWNDPILLRWMKALSGDYVMEHQLYSYSEFGAATSRRRLFVFGIRKRFALNDPDPNIFSKKMASFTRSPETVRSKIWDLRKKKMNSVSDHEWPILNTISKYEKYYRSGKFGWYILKWDKPAPSFGNVMKTYILHPGAGNGGPTRVISVSEAFLIMGFDGSFHFAEGVGLSSKYQMIVDSVSPVFSKSIARAIREILEQQSS